MNRLETQYETRQTGWNINKTTGLPEPVRTTYHIGHGQQLARARLADRRVELMLRHKGQDDAITRQQARRIIVKAKKADAADARKAAAAGELEALRATRAPWSLPKKHPGTLQQQGVRPFKKSHGRPNWRERLLTVLPNGDDVPAGCQATFHTTKGLRVVRMAAA